MTYIQEIELLIRSIHEHGSMRADLWPDQADLPPEIIGLVNDGLSLRWLHKIDLIEEDVIKVGFKDLDTNVFSITDSTNTQLVKRGSTVSIDGLLYLAEFQFSGRGRRGRTWVSPYGRNLSMSLGVATVRALSELGGLSLVVGLALADTFEALGISDLQLKWPNDILVDGKKLSGILVELVQRQSSVEYVVGMGVNVALTDQEVEVIDQPVTDLRRCGVTESRTELVIQLISRVRDYLAHFEHEGFAPFVSAFNDLHRFHGQTCSIIQGDTTITGVVTGIGEQGELILQTKNGEQRFHGGEVSLRSRAG